MVLGLGLYWYFIEFNRFSDFLVFGFGVLVGAFSVFGRADTGKPVQICGVFLIFVLFSEF